jgi:hypothetical protein
LSIFYAHPTESGWAYSIRLFRNSGIPEFHITTSSLPVHNSVKLNSTALIFGTHVEHGWKVCRAKKPLRSALNL